MSEIVYSFTVESRVFQILTCIRQEGASEWYLNTVKDLTNAVSRKDEKLHTAGLDDTAKPHIKKKIPKYRLKKNSIPQLFNTVNPHAPPLEKTDK